MKGRKKAQDIFMETKFVFGTKTKFEKAFPEIENITIEVIETGLYINDSRISHYNKTNTSEYVNCTNPMCYKGGFNLCNIIRDMIFKKDTERVGSAECQGNEGHHKSRDIRSKCLNSFSYKIQIEYYEQVEFSDEKKRRISE